MAAQLVTKRERGRDAGTERAMGEGPMTQSSLQQDDLLVKKRKRAALLSGEGQMNERERRKDKRLSPVYNAQVL